jgi:hypothetical protein
MMRNHIRVPLLWDAMPIESHSDGQCADYFPRTLQTLLLSLGDGESPLFVGTPRLL